MQSTKEQILTHLKRHGATSVDGVAAEFGLARMTVRQHLTRLERDGLVVSNEERRQTGRPHLMFGLSPMGEERFPRRYDRLANLVLREVSLLDADEIVGLEPAEKKRLLLGKMADRVFAEHEPRVRDKSLPERVALVTDILREEGGFAEWTVSGDVFEIADYNCVYRNVADSHAEVCDWHLSLLGQLLGQHVECNQFISQGAGCCRFVVKDNAGEPSTLTTEGAND